QGKLIPEKGREAEKRGERVCAKHCAGCHPAPHYTDNSTRGLKVERFYDRAGSTSMGKPGRAEGPIKTFPLRGIKDSPPYLHDGRLLTLEDTVEFFNLVLGLRLSEQDKADLVAFMRVL